MKETSSRFQPLYGIHTSDLRDHLPLYKKNQNLQTSYHLYKSQSYIESVLLLLHRKSFPLFAEAKVKKTLLKS